MNIKLTRNPFRWALAIVLIPVAPFAVYWLAQLVRVAGDCWSELALEAIHNDPWMLVIFAGVCSALIFASLVGIFFGKKTNTDVV